jgi:hypothetical protein
MRVQAPSLSTLPRRLPVPASKKSVLRSSSTGVPARESLSVKAARAWLAPVSANTPDACGTAL